MSTGYYLEDTPSPPGAPRQYGWERVRWWENGQHLSGAIGVHTSEAITDFEGVDNNAENNAAFIARRSDYGSYHTTGDADSIVPLVHPRYAAWADTTNNAHAMSVSGCLQAARWLEMTPERRAQVVRNMAYAAATMVLTAVRDGYLREVVPARRITAEEAINGTRPGFYGHGETNPGTRYDPGAHFDWTLFLDTYAVAAGLGLTIPEDDMTPEQFKVITDKIDVAIHHANRARGVVDSIEVPLHNKLLDVNTYVKGNGADQSVWELHGGKLRYVSGLEYRLLGEPDPAIVDQADIDAMPKAAAS